VNRPHRDCASRSSGASGASDAVDIVLGVCRQVVVDDQVDRGDVEPARGDVGRDEDVALASFELAIIKRKRKYVKRVNWKSLKSRRKYIKRENWHITRETKCIKRVGSR